MEWFTWHRNIKLLDKAVCAGLGDFWVWCLRLVMRFLSVRACLEWRVETSFDLICACVLLCVCVCDYGIALLVFDAVGNHLWTAAAVQSLPLILFVFSTLVTCDVEEQPSCVRHETLSFSVFLLFFEIKTVKQGLTWKSLFPMIVYIEYNWLEMIDSENTKIDWKMQWIYYYYNSLHFSKKCVL